MQKLTCKMGNLESGFFLHGSHQFCFESEHFLGNETLAHFWISFFELHHHPSPNTSVMKQTARSTLEVLLHLGGKRVRKSREWCTQLHSSKHLTELIHITEHACSVFSHTANLALLLSLKAIKWQMFRFYPS